MEITHQISARNFELIRDRIGEILTTELAGQTYTAGIIVWSERKIPFTLAELPAINVSYDNSGFDNKNVSYKRGENRYFIDIHVAEPSTDAAKGDILASKKAQRIAGIIDYILEFPIYDTLGFTPGFIAGLIVESINLSDMLKEDANHNLVCRLQFKVVAGENTDQIQPTTAEGYTTQVKLSETDYGHKYILNNE
jgi:hypothetical protein